MSGALYTDPGAGVIATLVRGSQVVAIHCAGTPRFALRTVVKRCDRYGWKIRTLSTPTTIYRDLQGTRMHAHSRRVDSLDTHGAGPTDSQLALPEIFMLNKIGRMDLLVLPGGRDAA